MTCREDSVCRDSLVSAIAQEKDYTRTRAIFAEENARFPCSFRQSELFLHIYVTDKLEINLEIELHNSQIKYVFGVLASPLLLL